MYKITINFIFGYFPSENKFRTGESPKINFIDIL